MNVFVDTSALLAILAANDRSHVLAKQVWTDLLTRQVNLIVTNYVLLETFSLVQRRLGMMAIIILQQDITPALRVEWVAEREHMTGLAAMLTAADRQLSLVDCVSFAAMRRLRIEVAFAFDRHFADQGFLCIPPTGETLAEEPVVYAEMHPPK